MFFGKVPADLYLFNIKMLNDVLNMLGVTSKCIKTVLFDWCLIHSSPTAI